MRACPERLKKYAAQYQHGCDFGINIGSRVIGFRELFKVGFEFSPESITGGSLRAQQFE